MRGSGNKTRNRMTLLYNAVDNRIEGTVDPCHWLLCALERFSDGGLYGNNHGQHGKYSGREHKIYFPPKASSAVKMKGQPRSLLLQ